MTSPHRLFFALEPDLQVRNEIAEVQGSLGAEGRAVHSSQFHVTLAFLGMQPADQLPALQDIASGLYFEPCTVVIDQPGIFRRPGVLWLSASHIPDSLKHFRQSLVCKLEDTGIYFDQKEWKLHITLYRRLRKPPPIMETMPVNWPLDGFSLIESISVKGGVEYHRRGYWTSSKSAK